MTAPEPDPHAVAELYARLFGNATAADDLLSWYHEFTDRAAIVRAVLERAEQHRAMTVAHLADTFGLTNKGIAGMVGDISFQRVNQLVATGRKHIKPLPHRITAQPAPDQEAQK